MPPHKIHVGVIMGAHGVRGQVRVKSLTAEPEDLFTYTPLTNEKGEKIFALKLQGVMKDYFVAALKDIKDRDAAEALRGTKLYVDRAALPAPSDEEYYHADLIGLKAVTEDGQPMGTVADVHDYGAGAFLEIKPANAASFMLPFKDAFVPTVDLITGTVLVIVPEGWLTKEDGKKKR